MDQEIKDKFDTLMKFLIDQMPTKAEMQEMRNELANKDDVNKLTTSVDALVKQTIEYNAEVKSLRYQVETMQKWIQQAAPKIGIEYKL